MVPSFYPMSQATRKLKGLPNLSVNRDAETGLPLMTLDQLIAESREHRFVDGPHIFYDGIVGAERGNPTFCPYTNDGKAHRWTNTKPVGIVGGGVSGLMTALQLLKAGIPVHLYEANDISSNIGGHAGRVWPVNVVDGHDSTKQQYGAMRFPTGAFLFWHYMMASGAASGSQVFKGFPNPGAVPTTLRSDNNCVAGIWKLPDQTPNAGDTEVLPIWPPALNQLNIRHIESLVKYTPQGTTNTAGDIGILLSNGGSMTMSDVTKVQNYWDLAKSQLYNITYLQYLQSRGFTADEIRQIGYVGIGTGGFAPLFGFSVLEMIRLTIWQYSTEMEVPSLHLLAPSLHTRIKAADTKNVADGIYPANSTIIRHIQPIQKVTYNSNTNSYGIIYKDGNSNYIRDEVNQLILAAHHAAVKTLLINSSTDSTSQLSGDITPYFDANLSYLKSDIKPELSLKSSVDSAKIFISVFGPSAQGSTANGTPYPFTQWTSAAIPAGRSSGNFDKRIRAQFGTMRGYAPIGTTFTFPPTSEFGGAGFGGKYTSIALHYTWGFDANNLWIELQKDAAVGAGIVNTGQYSGRYFDIPSAANFIYGMEGGRFAEYGSTNGISGNLGTGLSRYLDVSISPANPTVASFKIIYWPLVPYVWGGFKLDEPTIRSFMTFGYRTSALASVNSASWDSGTYNILTHNWDYSVHPSIKNFFCAGCSFSNLGGWIEGAFQSGLAVAAAAIYNRAILETPVGGSVFTFLKQSTFTALISDARNPYTNTGTTPAQ